MASNDSRKGILAQWEALKRQHPELAQELNEIDFLLTSNPQRARSEWRKLTQLDPSIPKNLLFDLQWAEIKKTNNNDAESPFESTIRDEDESERHFSVAHGPVVVKENITTEEQPSPETASSMPRERPAPQARSRRSLPTPPLSLLRTLGARGLTSGGTFGLIAAAIILFFIFLIIFIAISEGGVNDQIATSATCPNVQPQSTTPIPGLTLTLSGPQEIDITQPILYSLSINYDSNSAKLPRNRIAVYDLIPENTTFASASGVFDTEPIGSRSAILWNLKDNPEDKITLSLRATQEGICIVNMFSAVDSTINIREQQFPSETAPSDYQAAIKSEFGIQMDGFTPESLKWAYDKLKEVSRTKFINLERGHISKIFAKEYTPNDWTSVSNANGSSCPAQIELVEGWPAPDSEEVFKITLIHEISHVIDRCAPENLALGRNSFGIPGGFLEVYKKEGGATYYGQHANGTASPAISGPNMTRDSNCPDGNPISEDYADMLAYYLNPDSRQKDVCKTGRLANPYENGAYALHKSLAQRILGSF